MGIGLIVTWQMKKGTIHRETDGYTLIHKMFIFLEIVTESLIQVKQTNK